MNPLAELATNDLQCTRAKVCCVHSTGLMGCEGCCAVLLLLVGSVLGTGRCLPACPHPSAVLSWCRWLAIRLEFVGSLVVFFSALLAVIAKGTLEGGIVGLSVSSALNVSQWKRFLISGQGCLWELWAGGRMLPCHQL